MKTNLDKDTSFFITGVPRSGTTLLCNFFNSLEDGFCFGEPLRYYLDHLYCGGLRETVDNCFGKIKASHIPADLQVLNISEFPSIFPEYNLGGLKETYTEWMITSTGSILLENFHVYDLGIIVIRNPEDVFASNKALSEKRLLMTVRDLNNAYLFFNEMEIKHSNVHILVLEDFVTAGIDYVNSVLPFNIEGEFELKPTGHTYGDPYANKSTELKHNDRYVLLTEDEKEEMFIARQIWDRYRV